MGSALATLLRYQGLTASHVGAMLLREQRLRLRELLDVFGLRINALRSGNGPPIQITICNLRLPDSAAAPPGGWADPQGVSAALGYLLLFVDKVALLMGGPLLHEAKYQGSTSCLWLPRSFWVRAPASAGSVLPLSVVGSDASGGGAPAAAAAAARYQSASGGWDSWPLSRQGSCDVAAGIGLSTTCGTAATTSSARAGFELLQRSLACFLRDKAASFNLQLPSSWHPVAWLVVFSAVVKRDAKTDGQLLASASSTALGGGGGGALLGGAGGWPIGAGGGGGDASLSELLAAAQGPGGSAVAGALAQQTALWAAAEGVDDEDEDEEGWGMVHTPWLPPPPSQPEEVEHWTRAMFTDATATGGAVPAAPASSGTGAGAGASAATPFLGSSPQPGGLLSVERIRSLFGKQ